MTFKDVREGYKIHFLTQDSNGLHYQANNVINVSTPYFPPQNLNSGLSNPGTLARYIDITTQVNGKTVTYTVNENSSVSEAPGGVIISTDPESLSRELEAMKNNSQELLNQVDKHKQIIKDCESILEQLNPALAEKKLQDNRIQKLEEQVNGMNGMLEKILSAVNKTS